jgi:hypothetical protein
LYKLSQVSEARWLTYYWKGTRANIFRYTYPQP